ncbi:MAG: GlcNAc-PI de-N-acetylase [Frankiales bacterium]|nr:GlcNAc-PI de-N-acetylase [Frankiales bacterium]
MTDHVLTLMAVHAHPDDEATGTGGVLARYAAEGIRTILVTCTDGRCGDGPDGVKPGEPGHDPAAVVATRRVELEAACKVLGVSQLELLGYADSGMMGWPDNDAPGAFWRTPVEESAARVAELIRRHRPDVVVTYDENGFYGHPDHIMAHRVTMAAVAAVAEAAPDAAPKKLYWTTVPRSAMEEMGRVMRELGADWDAPDPSGEGGQSDSAQSDSGQADSAQSDSDQPPIGLPDEEITTWVDVKAFGPQKFEALAAHASQSENIFFLKMGLERFTEMMGVETFVRVRDDTDAALPEDDLFAGLR